MKIVLAVLVTALMILSGCSSKSVETKQIVEIGSYASCFQVELHDSEGNNISVPSEIEESFECVTGAVELSSNNEYLLYDYVNEEGTVLDLKLYDFNSQNSVTLVSLDSSLEGIGCIWNDASTVAACVAVNQLEYDAGTKIFIFEIEEGELVQKKEFAQTHETMVDFTCGASCYPGDFWFEDEGTLKYNGHNVVAPGEVFEIRY